MLIIKNVIKRPIENIIIRNKRKKKNDIPPIMKYRIPIYETLPLKSTINVKSNTKIVFEKSWRWCIIKIRSLNLVGELRGKNKIVKDDLMRSRWEVIIPYIDRYIYMYLKRDIYYIVMAGVPFMGPYLKQNWALNVHCVYHNGRIITATEHWPFRNDENDVLWQRIITFASSLQVK